MSTSFVRPEARRSSGSVVHFKEGTKRLASPRVLDGLMFLLLFSGPPRFRARDMTASLRGEADLVVLLRLAIWGGGCVWLFLRLYPVLVARGIMPPLRPPQLIGSALLVVLAMGIWIAPGRMLTLVAVYQLGVMLLFSWLFIRLYGPEAHLRYLFWGYGLLALALVAAWIFMPELVVRRGRLRGDLIAPAGAIGAFGLVFCLSNVMRLRRSVLLVATGLFTLVLAAAQTRTAFAAFVGFLVVGSLFRYPVPVRKSLPLLALLLVLAGLFDVLPAGREYVVREEQSLATMSDRVPLWRHLIGTMLRESPLVGLGYYSASRVLGPQYNPALGNAHSSFVEVLVGGGMVGGLLFLALVGMLGGYAAKLLLYGRANRLAATVVGLLAITIVLSITDTDGIQVGPIGFTFWSLAALLPAVWDEVRWDRDRNAGNVFKRGYARPAPT